MESDLYSERLGRVPVALSRRITTLVTFSMVFVTMSSTLADAQTVRAKCQNVRPYAVENVTVTPLSKFSARVSFDLPLEEWVEDKPQSLRIVLHNQTTEGLREYDNIALNTTSYVLENLIPDNAYRVRVFATNSAGRPGCSHPKVTFIISLNSTWSDWITVRPCNDSRMCRPGSPAQHQHGMEQRHCITPFYGGRPCLGNSTRILPCPLNCPENNGTDTMSPPNPAGFSLLHLILAAILSGLAVIIAIPVLVYCYVKRCTVELTSSSEQTVPHDNFSVALSNLDNATFLDWKISSLTIGHNQDSGCAAARRDGVNVYVCYAHNIPNGDAHGRYQRHASKLATILGQHGISPVYPGYDINAVMSDVQGWFYGHSSELDAIVVMCTPRLVKMWSSAEDHRHLEAASLQLAHHELNFVKRSIQEHGVPVIPLIINKLSDTQPVAAFLNDWKFPLASIRWYDTAGQAMFRGYLQQLITSLGGLEQSGSVAVIDEANIEFESSGSETESESAGIIYSQSTEETSFNSSTASKAGAPCTPGIHGSTGSSHQGDCGETSDKLAVVAERTVGDGAVVGAVNVSKASGNVAAELPDGENTVGGSVRTSCSVSEHSHDSQCELQAAQSTAAAEEAAGHVDSPTPVTSMASLHEVPPAFSTSSEDAVSHLPVRFTASPPDADSLRHTLPSSTQPGVQCHDTATTSSTLPAVVCDAPDTLTVAPVSHQSMAVPTLSTPGDEALSHTTITTSETRPTGSERGVLPGHGGSPAEKIMVLPRADVPITQNGRAMGELPVRPGAYEYHNVQPSTHVSPAVEIQPCGTLDDSAELSAATRVIGGYHIQQDYSGAVPCMVQDEPPRPGVRLGGDISAMLQPVLRQVSWQRQASYNDAGSVGDADKANLSTTTMVPRPVHHGASSHDNSGGQQTNGTAATPRTNTPAAPTAMVSWLNRSLLRSQSTH